MTMQKLVESKPEVQWCSVPVNRTKTKIGVPQPQSDTWVQLLKSFSPYSADEALLLCPISNWEWAAWIPNHGEAVVSIEHFCYPTMN